jgi:hypothetical protein
MAKDMEKELCTLKIKENVTLETGKMEKGKEMANISLPLKMFTLENGIMIKNTVKVH